MSKHKKSIEQTIKDYHKRIIHDIKHNDGNNIINGKESIYLHDVTSLDGIRPNKRTCIYYDKITKYCTNKKCSKSICTTAQNCTCYKRKSWNQGAFLV